MKQSGDTYVSVGIAASHFAVNNEVKNSVGQTNLVY